MFQIQTTKTNRANPLSRCTLKRPRRPSTHAQFFHLGSTKTGKSLTSVSSHVVQLLLIPPRAPANQSGKYATKTISCHVPTQLALTTLLRRGDALLSRGRDLLNASSCRTWDPDVPRTENGSVDAQRQWAGVSGLRKQVVSV